MINSQYQLMTVAMLKIARTFWITCFMLLTSTLASVVYCAPLLHQQDANLPHGQAEHLITDSTHFSSAHCDSENDDNKNTIAKVDNCCGSSCFLSFPFCEPSRHAVIQNTSLALIHNEPANIANAFVDAFYKPPIFLFSI